MKKIAALLGASSMLFSSIALGTDYTLSTSANTQNNSLAQEVVELIENSLSENFAINANIDLTVEGKETYYDETYTDYSISYTAPSFVLQKNDMQYAIVVEGETIEFVADGTSGPTDLFPLQLEVQLNEEAVMDFETFQFAGRFDILDINTFENDSLRRIVDGVVEMMELFEGKWIVLDFLEIESEFPEMSDQINEMKEEVAAALEEVEVAEIYAEMIAALEYGIQSEMVSVTKKGDEYTIELQALPGVESTNPMQLIITEQRGKIDTIEIMGDIAYTDYWGDTMSITTDSEIAMQYVEPTIVFPQITKEDWEVTSIIEMFLELSKDDIMREAEERSFYENLNMFSGNAEEAVKYLQTNGTDADKAFVEEYIQVAKKMDRRIRMRDLLVLENHYNTYSQWQVQNIYDELTYSPYDYEGDRMYNTKYALEAFMVVVSDNMEYAYIPWDVYDTLDISMKDRGDVLVALAKIRMAEAAYNQ